MRDYGAIYNGFWSNESLKEAGDDARFLAAYLLTSPHTSTLGAFRLPDAYGCEDLGWTSERFRNGLKALSDIGFIQYDQASKWVWIVKFLTWNRPANPNIWKAIAKAARAVPSSVPFRDSIALSAGLFETVSEQIDNIPSPSPSPSTSPSPASRAKAKKPTRLPDDFSVSERVKAWAQEKGYGRLDEHLEAFRTTAEAKGYTYADWDAAFMNAIRSDWAKLRANGAASLPGGGRRAL